MTLSEDQNIDVLRSMPRLLMTESAEEFAFLRAELAKDIQPKGFIERIYVDDIAAIIWEILRMRRVKTGIITNAIPAALRSLLKQLMFSPYFLAKSDVEERASELALGWFENRKRKKEEVSKLLYKFQLDETATEAEAFRLMASDLERADKMLSSLQSRLSKALRCIADHRQSLALQIRQSTDRILPGDDVPFLVHSSKNSATV